MSAERAMASYRVEPMDAGHLDAVLAIERLSQSNPWSEPAFRHELEANPFSRPRVALTRTKPGRVAGFCICWVVFDEAHVQNVAVHPAHRRSGIARLLLHHALEDAEAAGAKNVELEVRRSNAAAQRLYASLGFEIVGERLGYYSKPREDAVRFKKELARGMT